MYKVKKRVDKSKLALAVAAGIASLMTAATANAQNVEDDVTSVEEIVITGSRIDNSNLTQSSPVASISA